MNTIKVWDLPLRLFHWSLVLLVSFSGITGSFSDEFGPKVLEWHKLSGYAILSLVIFRLLWGFFGGTQARFANFLRGPRTVAAYLRQLRAGESAPQLGHNPAGGWSVLLMLACLALQAGTGLFLSDEDLAFEGPLAKLVSSHTGDLLKEVHEANFVVLLTLIALHLSAIAFYFFAKRENLVRPMFTGRKAVAGTDAKGGHTLAGAVLLAVGAAAVWFIVNRL